MGRDWSSSNALLTCGLTLGCEGSAQIPLQAAVSSRPQKGGELGGFEKWRCPHMCLPPLPTTGIGWLLAKPRNSSFCSTWHHWQLNSSMKEPQVTLRHQN